MASLAAVFCKCLEIRQLRSKAIERGERLMEYRYDALWQTPNSRCIISALVSNLFCILYMACGGSQKMFSAAIRHIVFC